MKPAYILVTGSLGLVGSQAARYFVERGYHVVGVDNDMRGYFFGAAASTAGLLPQLTAACGDAYIHYPDDIRNADRISALFKQYDFSGIIHCAAQPSHDWAARQPDMDFSINATATLLLLECARAYCPQAVFIFTSTNKVYGDTPNQLPVQEAAARWDLPAEHPQFAGLDEHTSIDQSLHSIFGASKIAADVMVQEYGRYFGMKTVCFRGGCLTGPAHRGARLHGFLSFLAHCIAREEQYTIYGYAGKQVRDNIHVRDLLEAFWNFFQTPRCGEVYNIGGSRYAHCSVREAIALFEQALGKTARVEYQAAPRRGDHRWYVSDVRKFQEHYPQWRYTYDISRIVEELARAAHDNTGGSVQ